MDVLATDVRSRFLGRIAGTILPALLVGTLCMASPATAATIDFTDVFALDEAEISGVLSVPRFDPALGNLTGVGWSITGAVASILGISNDSARTITGSASTSVDFDVSSDALTLGSSPDFNVFGSTGLVTLGVGESALFPVTSESTITGSEAPSAAFLLPGTIDLSFLTSTSLGGNALGGNVTISQATDAGISFTITYEYTVVPEPGSLVMLAFGVLGFAGVRGRHLRRQV